MATECKRRPPVAFTVRLQADHGIHFDDMAEQAIRLAATLGVWIETEFNRIHLCIGPEDTAPQVLKRYNRACAYRAANTLDGQGAATPGLELSP